MINVFIPNNNIPEREYILRTLFTEYLGLQLNININDTNRHYSICFDESELIIRDSFFNIYPDSLSYLTINALPGEIVCVKNDFTFENNIPLIYGTNELQVSDKKIICGIDIFASSFFMLTRWEEYVNKTRDEHNRLPANESIANKNGFLSRPVVNEYVEFLWRLLQMLGYNGIRKQCDFELVLTHDIDHLDYPTVGRTVLADILKRRKLKLAQKTIKNYLKSGINPYDYFDFLMSSSEKLGLKSHFYFMAANTKIQQDTPFYLKSNRFKSKIAEIRKRGHLIGFHPGYSTSDNLENWSSEKLLLEKAIQEKVVEGRQHYLCFDVPTTFRLWNKNNMKIDSTLGYAKIEGYRCGTGNLFPVFDFLERKQLNLKERPLIIMDGTLRQLQQYTRDEALAVIQNYITVAKRYNSTLTLLFHNSSFYGDWEGYSDLYSKLIDSLV